MAGDGGDGRALLGLEEGCAGHHFPLLESWGSW